MRKSLFKRLAVACMALLIGWSVSAQSQVTLSGQVVDDYDEPLMGVGVIQQGTTHGVATDLDGMYSITVPAGTVVEFSYIGFKAQTFVAEKTMTLNVKLLPDTEMLEETIVVGYGVQKKSDVTGAISQVKSEDIANRTITSPEAALQGKTAGVQAFASSDLTWEIAPVTSDFFWTP